VAEQIDMQSVPVKMYRALDMLTVAAPMPGLVAMPMAESTRPARLRLEAIGPARGERVPAA
jgi:hypothetical protein